MKKTILSSAALLTALVTLGSVPAPVQAAAQCGVLPAVDWWGKSHASVINTVNKRYKGNWDEYMKRWEKYQSKMTRLHENGETAVVKSRGLRLEGETLKEHVVNIDQRINVMKCLRAQEEEKLGDNLEKFSTAAGGDQSSTSAPREQTASLTDTGLNVEVSARCEADRPTFVITNLGEKWPKLGAIKIFNAENKALLSKRRIRLTSEQQATFRLSKQRAANANTVGLYVEPSWADRPFAYDARISCK